MWVNGGRVDAPKAVTRLRVPTEPPVSAAPPGLAAGIRRTAWAGAGFTCLAVAAAGIVLPGVPTTGPTLLALACFTRSSPALRQWLLSHERFGPFIREWEQNRTMPRKAKVAALTMMSASGTYIGLFSAMPLWAKAAALAFLAYGAWTVARIPSSRNESQSPAEPAKTESPRRRWWFGKNESR